MQFISCTCLVAALSIPLGVLAQEAHSIRVVNTLAGTAGSKGITDGAGATAHFNFPHSLVVDSSGLVYVADMNNHVIRKITPLGVVTTVAGLSGNKGTSDGTGAAARFDFPAGIALGTNGIIYVADAGSHLIRQVTPSGVVTTLAGAAGRKGSTDGISAAARFNSPHGIAVAANGIVYVADTYNHTIRKITPAGVVTTLAGQVGHKGQLDGPGATASFFHPSGVAVDALGTLYVADNGNHIIRKITSTGIVSTLAGEPGRRGSTNGPAAVARFDVPASLAVDAQGTVFVADYINSIIRQITPQGQVTTFAGLLKGWGSLDGKGEEARFNFPFGIAVRPNGWVYVADSGNQTIRVIK